MTSTPYLKVFLPALLLCLAFALAACQEAESDPDEQQEAAPAEAEEVVRQYIDAYNAQDLAALEETLADPITYNGEDYALDEFLGLVQGYWKAFTDLDLDPTHIVGTDEHVTVRMMFSGTGEGEYLGHDVEGKDIRVSETVLFHVSGGQIDEYWGNWDELGFWEQLGILESPYPEE